jgi:hypothetical protein
MATLSATIFLLQFLLVFIIIIAKLLNLMSAGKLYEFKYSILGFAMYFFFWGIGLIITIIEYDSVIYSAIQQLETYFILLNVVFFLGELFFLMSDTDTKQARPARNSRKEYEQ